MAIPLVRRQRCYLCLMHRYAFVGLMFTFFNLFFDGNDIRASLRAPRLICRQADLMGWPHEQMG